MDLSRLTATSLRAVLAETGMPADSFVVGQHLNGRVLQALSDSRFLLAFGDRRVVAETRLPLQVGDRLAVEVMQTGASVELRLEQQVLPSAQQGEQNYAMAALLNALVGRDSQAAVADVTALMRSLIGLRAAGDPAVPQALFEGLARILQPLVPAGDRDLVAQALKTWLQNSGLLFEAHLRAALSSRPPLTPEEALAALQADLKVLAGQLARQLEARQAAVGQTPAGGPPGGEAAAATAHLMAGAATQQALLMERVLAQQVEFAYRWLKEGVAAFDVPVRLPEGEAWAKILFRREGGGGASSGQGSPYSISVLVPSDVLGTVEANARWQAGSLDGVFYVERDRTRDVLSAGLEILTTRLAAVFRHVAFEVKVDPDRVHRTAAPPIAPTELPGGSIVSVRV